MSKTHHPNIYCKYFNRGHKIFLTLCCFVSALAFVVFQFLVYTKNCGCLHVHIQRFIWAIPFNIHAPLREVEKAVSEGLCASASLPG